ncbi:MAG: hypothetical protein HKN91_07550 [Acidimicrobiia bacterium]|nr:hypothetical protein [Acidimicrobiia bacterium]
MSHEVGILFVHGLGNQPRGQTLVSFGEPLFECIQDSFDGVHAKWGRQGLTRAAVSQWEGELEAKHERQLTADELETLDELISNPELSAGDSQNTIGEMTDDESSPVALRTVVDHAEARAASAAAEPASANVELTRINANGDAVQSNWLLAESWWALTFAPPRYRDLLAWGIRAIPWTFGSHFGVTLMRRWQRFRKAPPLQRPLAIARVLAAAIYLLLTPILILTTLALMLLLWLPAILPIPRVRSAVVGMQRALTGSLGDSFILLNSPLQAASIRSQLRSDIKWLTDQDCKKVVVVAHSQGAAVSYDVLRKADIEIDLLVTFGSGLQKLAGLRNVQRHGRMERLTAATLIAITGLAYGLASALTPNLSDRPSGVGFALIGAVAYGYVVRNLVKEQSLGDVSMWSNRMRQAGIDWHDFYAADDPVPNGQLMTDDEFPISTEVRNRDSIATDHTTYWDNTDEFTLPVTSLIADRDLHFAGLFAAAKPEAAAVARHYRVGYLAATRRVTIAALVAVLAGHWTEASDAVTWLTNLVGLTSSEESIKFGEQHWQAAGYAAAIGASFFAMSYLWGWWDNRAALAVVQRKPFEPITYLSTIMFAVGLAPVVVAFVALGLFELASGPIIAIFVFGGAVVGLFVTIRPLFRS